MQRIRRYWANKTSVISIRKTMSRDRYFLLRKHLKVVDDNTISEEERNDDKLWRLRPYLERIRSGCLEIPRPSDCCVDEQMIPFTGRASIRQYVKNKPNPNFPGKNRSPWCSGRQQKEIQKVGHRRLNRDETFRIISGR